MGVLLLATVVAGLVGLFTSACVTVTVGDREAASNECTVAGVRCVRGDTRGAVISNGVSPPATARCIVAEMS